MTNKELISKLEERFDKYNIITPKIAFEDLKVILLDKQFGDLKMSFRFSETSQIIYSINVINIGIYELSYVIKDLIDLLEGK